jgi:hypothetical protein
MRRRASIHWNRELSWRLSAAGMFFDACEPALPEIFTVRMLTKMGVLRECLYVLRGVLGIDNAFAAALRLFWSDFAAFWTHFALYRTKLA